MAETSTSVVSVTTTGPNLPDGVVGIADLPADYANGCRVFVHYNGPTDQLRGVCTGMAVLDPGASPHPPHRHPEEEFLIIADGTGVIECEGVRTEVGPGAILYCAANALHGITNTGPVPLTFYWSKWIAKGF
jgi:mannose-6-phosphate isomerase-like protein (cupin superfamily)